jgi:short-subunit dehydrogenase
VEYVAANLADADAIAGVVARHRECFGRLDVLVNNAGVGIGAAATDHQNKHVDIQFDVNIRAVVLFYREAIEMLKAAGAEHGEALVVNLASVAGKSPQPWLSVYSATKASVIAYTNAMNNELNADGVKSTAFCPGFVDTDMSDFVKDSIPAEAMLKTSDVAEALRFLLRVSPQCVIPEVVFQRAGGTF